MSFAIRPRLVDDWQRAHKWSSVRLHAAMLVANGICAAMPTLDPSIANALPKAFQSPVIGIYAAVSIALRMTKLKPDVPQPPPNGGGNG